MLTLLRISGFALIDEVELAFGPGLTVITGETGAGKSILVEALGLLRGARAGADLIRTGRDEARVEAIFELPAGSPARARLAERRPRPATRTRVWSCGASIARAGRGRAHLGGSLATAADLAAHRGPLIDIASQHDQQSLTDPDSQLAILDAFADNAALRAEMAAAHAAAVDARGGAGDVLGRRARPRRARGPAALSARRAGRGAAGGGRGRRAGAPSASGCAAPSSSSRRRRAARRRSTPATARSASAIAAVLRELEPLAALDPALAPLAERLRGGGGRRRGRRPRSRALRARRPLRSGAPGRDRGAAVPAVSGSAANTAARWPSSPPGARRWRAELAELGSFEEGVAARQAAVDEARRARARQRRRRCPTRASARPAAWSARSARRCASSGSRRRGCRSRSRRGSWARRGADRVRFLFAPNPGEQPRPLAKIASGGELSRVMLAVKQALARTDDVLTYVFDEVDAGIGGGTAEVVGRKLKRIAADRQVIVITHLPQVAAFADAHVRVTKTSAAARPTSRSRRWPTPSAPARSPACWPAPRRPPRPPPTPTRCCATPARSEAATRAQPGSVNCP